MDRQRIKEPLERVRHALKLHLLPEGIRRVLVAVIGGTLLLLGAAMIVLPGPAVIILPLGLALLATEFLWARRLIRKGESLLKNAKATIMGK